MKSFLISLLFLVSCNSLQETGIVEDMHWTPPRPGVPEIFSVNIRCEHGLFFLDDKASWLKFHPFDKVVIEYRELYRQEDEYRVVYDYEILSVQLAPK